MGAKNCRLLTPETVKESLSSFDTVLFDCDGVLWRGSETLEGAVELTTHLTSIGKRVGYVTNNSYRSQKQTMDELNKRGLPTPEPDLVLCTARATALYIKKRFPNGNIFRLGNPGMVIEFDREGINHWTTENTFEPHNLTEYPVIDAVVHGMDKEINFHRLLTATNLLYQNKNAVFVATNMDPTFPEAAGRMSVGCGSLVSALASSVQRPPDVIVGKPNSTIFDMVAADLNLNGQRTLVVGDRCDTDIGFASSIGGASLLVLTGVEKLEDAQKHTLPDATNPEYAPTCYSPSVNEFYKILKLL